MNYLKWFIGPIGKYVSMALIALLLTGGGVAYVKGRIKAHDNQVLADAKAARDLASAQKAVKDAKADLAFQTEQKTKADGMAAQARQELQDALSKQEASVAPVRAKVASGELPTASADPTILAYIWSTK